MQRTGRFATAFGAVLLATAPCGAPLRAEQTSATLPPHQDTLAQISQTIERGYPAVQAIVLARGNCIVHEYYRNKASLDERWHVWSVTKSVLSILVGIAIDKRLLRLDQRLPELLAQGLGEAADPRAADITLRDLLTMTSGFDPDQSTSIPGIWSSSIWMIDRPVQHAPGSHFAYDNPAADLIGIILARAVGGKLEEFAREELFNPLEIDSYQWRAEPDGHLSGQSGLQLSARNMAKLGLLYLQHGRWRARQVISREYVLDSTRKHNNGGDPVRTPYGYLWWTTTTSDGSAAYFAAGAHGQKILNVPDRDLVVAITSVPSRSGRGRSAINDVILPAERVLPARAPCIARLE